MLEGKTTVCVLMTQCYYQWVNAALKANKFFLSFTYNFYPIVIENKNVVSYTQTHFKQQWVRTKVFFSTMSQGN